MEFVDEHGHRYVYEPSMEYPSVWLSGAGHYVLDINKIPSKTERESVYSDILSNCGILKIKQAISEGRYSA